MSYAAREPVFSRTETPSSELPALSGVEDGDQTLARLVQQGDRDAFQQLYRNYATGLMRRLRRLTGDADQAEDCLQQVFMQALQNIQQYTGKGSFEGWLNKIATNVVLGLFRKQRYWKSVWTDLWPERKENTQETIALPDRLFLQKERAQLLHRLLGKLDARKRMSILLCDFEGLSIAEAANELGIPPGTVGSRLHNGRRELKQLLKDELNHRDLSLEEWLHG